MDIKVAIIIGYYNGEKFFSELIDSIFSQTFTNFQIFIFDDNSTIPLDISKLDLSNAQKKKIKVYRRKKNLGFCMNFLKGLSQIDDGYDYYSYCDQDDIWNKDKLSRGIKVMESKGSHVSKESNLPMLYGTKTSIVNKDCSKVLGESISIKRPLTFNNAIFQSFAGGNTMIFNLSTKKLITKKLNFVHPISHDWWTYLCVSGFGGKVFYDPNPSLLYRQHHKNQMGTNKSWSGRLIRLIALIKGDFKVCMERNLGSLKFVENILNPENKTVLEDFSKARKSNLILKLYLYKKSGVYRQNILGSFIFLILFIFNRI